MTLKNTKLKTMTYDWSAVGVHNTVSKFIGKWPNAYKKKKKSLLANFSKLTSKKLL